MKQRIAQVDGFNDIDTDMDIESKDIEDNRNTGENELPSEITYYIVELDSNGHHAGHGTP